MKLQQQNLAAAAEQLRCNCNFFSVIGKFLACNIGIPVELS